MGRRKKRLTAAQRAERAQRRAEFMWVFRNGKRVRVPRPQLIDGLSVEEFVEQNADPIWLHQEGLWELMPVEGVVEPIDTEVDAEEPELPFEPHDAF